MNRGETEREITEIKDKLVRIRAAKPAHGRGGKYELELFELEELLREKRKALAEAGPGE